MNIILDYDGTIHDCGKIYVPAVRIGYKYLVDNSYAQPREFTDEYINSFLGYSVKDMWARFMPELPEKLKDECGKIIADKMNEMAENGKSVLYDGAEEALEKLKKDGHNLIFLSNCIHSYMETHRKAHGLDRFYSDFYCTEDYDFMSKPEIFAKIKDNYDGSFIVVGDRYLDLQLAQNFSLRSIGCLYGYAEKNELDQATIKVNSVREIPKAVNKICI